MKKRLGALTLIIVLMISCLTGCGKKGIVGTYKLESVSVSGMTVSVSDESASTLGITPDSIKMTIKDDTTGAFTMDGEEADFTYTVDGSTIKITVDGETASGKIEGNKITIEIDGQSITLSKK